MRSKAVPYDDSRRDVDALTPPAGFGRRTGAWFVHELGEMLPPTPMRRRFSKAAGRPPFIRSESCLGVIGMVETLTAAVAELCRLSPCQRLSRPGSTYAAPRHCT